MSIALITGSNGLVGSESVKFFSKKGFDIIGIDNNLREFFFGKDGSTKWVKQRIEKEIQKYTHSTQILVIKIRKNFKKYKKISQL